MHSHHTCIKSVIAVFAFVTFTSFVSGRIRASDDHLWDAWSLIDRILQHYILAGRDLGFERTEYLAGRVKSMRSLIKGIDPDTNPHWDLKTSRKDFFGRTGWDRDRWTALRDVDDALRLLEKPALKQDVELSRAGYSRLSDALARLLQTGYNGTRELYLFVCPLSNRLWINAGPEPQNPYLGIYWQSGAFHYIAKPLVQKR